MPYYVSRGEVTSGIILDNDSMYVYYGGTADETAVNSNGYMYVSSGGTATSATVNSGGEMYVSSGGTATEITADTGAYLGLTVAPDTYIQGTSAGSAFLVKNAFISDYTVKFGSWISVSSGTANYTNVNGGSMSIRSGGTANHTTVNFGGRLGIASGGCRARRSPAGLDSATRKTSSDSS